MLGGRIGALRRQAGYTQAELAQKLDEKGKEMNLSIRLQREDIFEAMHRV